MRTRFLFSHALPVVAVLSLASPAWAASAQDQATADVLFKDAKKLAEAGDFEHACPKFVESQRLDPSSGTLLNVGDCYEKLGKLASSYGAFREAEVSARNSGDTARQAEAVRRAELLSPKLAKLEIVVPGATRAIPGLTIKKEGGAVIGEGQWGTPLPADVGNYTIEASAPGYKTWTSTIRIAADGSSASVWVPALEKLPLGATGGADGFTWTTQRRAGAVVGGVGVAGLAIGGILGGVALSKASSLRSGGHCNADLTVCDATGHQLRQDAKTIANASTGALVAGSAVLATGVVVVVTGSPNATPSPSKSGGRMIIGPVASLEMTGVLIRGGW